MRSEESLWRLVLPPFLVSRVVGLLVAVLSAWQGSNSIGFPSAEEIRSAFDQWDAQSYVAIAQHGYPSTIDFGLGQPGHLLAFFPGYPMLVHAVMVVTRDAVLAGLVVSTVCELVALRLLAGIVLAERDLSAARFTVWVLALAPHAAFLGLVYTESAFIAAAAGCLLLARRGRIAAACGVGALALAIRPTGLALLPALLVEELVRHRWRPTFRLGWLLLVPVPMLLFWTYLRLHTGDWNAWFHAESSVSFDHHLDWPWVGARATWDSVVLTSVQATSAYVFVLELLFGTGGAVVCAWLWLTRRLPLSLITYCTGVWLLSVCVGFWISVPRYELAMFPVLIAVWDLVARRPEWRAALITASAGLFAYGAGLYASGRWLG